MILHCAFQVRVLTNMHLRSWCMCQNMLDQNGIRLQDILGPSGFSDLTYLCTKSDNNDPLNSGGDGSSSGDNGSTFGPTKP